MPDNFFMGKNGFVWWFGRVECNDDPMFLGRCQVRIAGWHTENIDDLPTDALPWAYPITPITNPAVAGVGVSPIGPQPGTRVFGFFLDGESAQSPVMLGTVPGQSVNQIKRKQERNSTPWQPLFDSLLGNAQMSKEGENGDGGTDEVTSTNRPVPNPQNVQVSGGEWTVPFTGFVSSAYGEARNGYMHRGVDICPAGFYKQTDAGAPHLNGRLKGPTGLPVRAAAAGEVVHIWTADKGQGGVPSAYDRLGPNSTPQPSRSYGNAIAIKHTLSTGTYITIYAHLGNNQDPAKDQPGAGINVSVGQRVGKGQQIGTVGRSHVWNSPTHLHFEIRVGDALPKANNHINPGIVFPQMAHTHGSFLSTVNSKTNYNLDKLPFELKEAPVVAGEGPKQ